MMMVMIRKAREIASCFAMITLTLVMIIIAASDVQADINKTYTVTVGKVDKLLFRGSAKKVVVTSLEGVPTRLWQVYRKKKHSIKCKPKCSKTIRPYSGLGGPINLVARSSNRDKLALLLVEVEEVVCNRPETCSGFIITSEQLRKAREWLRQNGYTW